MERQSLEKLHTKQLLNLLRGNRAGVHRLNKYYVDPTPEEAAAAEADANLIKSILATREHVPGKDEAKQIRQAKQKAKQAR
jgi:hypothetical protein